jgi:hypothetical protein
MIPEREAQSIYALARSLVAQRGSVVRIHNAVTIAIDGNTLTVTRDTDRTTVMTAIAGGPPMFATFRPGAWKKNGHILECGPSKSGADEASDAVEDAIADPKLQKISDARQGLFDPTPLSPNGMTFQVNLYIGGGGLGSFLRYFLFDVLSLSKPIEQLLENEAIGERVKPRLVVNQMPVDVDHLAKMPADNVKQENNSKK